MKKITNSQTLTKWSNY